MANVDSLDIRVQTSSDKATSALDKLSSVLSKLKSSVSNNTSSFTNLSKNLDSISSSTNSATSSMSKLDKTFNNLNNSFHGGTKGIRDFVSAIGLGLTGVSSLGELLGHGTQLAMDYIENLNLFSVSLGDYAQEAYNYAEQVQAIMGIDPSTLMRYQGVFMTLATGFGVAADKAYTMSQQLVQLGYDISSFYNLPIEEAMLKLQSGLSGELEPLRRIGYVF